MDTTSVGSARPEAVRRLLTATTVPPALVDEILRDAPDLWLANSSPDLLASDLTLCHPPVRAGEVRAAARPVDGDHLRLTVVAHDRRGLLADTTGVVTAAGFPVAAATAVTWGDPAVGMHSLIVTGGGASRADWDELGVQLRAVGAGQRPIIEFSPLGQAVVGAAAYSPDRTLVTVDAADQPGLLWAICSWFADHQVSIETADVTTAPDGWARDRFVVRGEPDVAGLARRLTG